MISPGMERRHGIILYDLTGMVYDKVWRGMAWYVEMHRGSTVGFLLLQCSSGVVRHPRDLQVSVTTRCFC